MRHAERYLDLTIIIVTYNSEKALASCLESLGETLSKRVFVVDNASMDQTRSVASEHNVPVISLQANLGFAVAANIAARRATTKYICFLNPDCHVNEMFFDHAFEVLQRTPSACVVPAILEEEGLHVNGKQPGYTRWKLIDNILQANYGSNPLSRILRNLRSYHDSTWHWPHGACFILELQQFLAVEFNTSFFLYMEDVDFGQRLTRSGGTILCVDHKVLHSSRQGSQITKRERLFLLNRGRIRYARMYYGRIFAAFLQMMALPGSTLRNLLQYRS